jgi:hypothetical protein
MNPSAQVQMKPSSRSLQLALFSQGVELVAQEPS